MRAFVTGATGFIGGRLMRRLRDRGDEVVALVRSSARADELRGLGCKVVAGDLNATEALRSAMDGCDAVVHAAAVYRVGIPRSERAGMYEANVRGTDNLLTAAVAAAVPRIVHVSTLNVFGDTRGEVVDESHERDLARGFLSCYDETKWLAHEVAKERAAHGAPVVIAAPGGVYGPGDPSQLGRQIDLARRGRLTASAFGSVGLNFAHVDDAANGILLVLERGGVGETYALGGELARLRDALSIAARAAGYRPPLFELPAAPIRLVARLVPRLAEMVSASDGVTYWCSDGKARAELGYAPRGLEEGLRQTVEAV